jgi:multidrug resistance efflux pump
MVDEKQIYKVIPGQPVRIYCQQYNYLDYGYFTGKVTDIYQLPVEKNGINYYPVRIVLDGEEYPLRFGSGCEVTILTGQERIFFVLTNLNSKDYLKRRTRTLKKVLKIDKKKGAKNASAETSAELPAEEKTVPAEKK